jgi:hypothetical protein
VPPTFEKLSRVDRQGVSLHVTLVKREVVPAVYRLMRSGATSPLRPTCIEISAAGSFVLLSERP